MCRQRLVITEATFCHCMYIHFYQKKRTKALASNKEEEREMEKNKTKNIADQFVATQ